MAAAKDNIRQEAKNILTHYIEMKKMRKTPERFAILDAILNMTGHHTVEEIQSMMPDDFPVSRPTIYTTMQMLDELGIVVSHQLNGTTLYEKAIGVKPHHHYVCTSCGMIKDLVDSHIDYILNNAKTPRFSKQLSMAYIFGLCSTCKAVINKRKKKEQKILEAQMSREEKRFAQIDKDLEKIAEEMKRAGFKTRK